MLKMITILLLVVILFAVYCIITTKWYFKKASKGMSQEELDDASYEALKLTQGMMVFSGIELHTSYGIFRAIMNPWLMLRFGILNSPVAVMGNIIVYNAMFLELQQNARNFIILHEFGHVQDTINTRPKYYHAVRILYAISGRVLPMEAEADRYAAEIYGIDKSVLALKQIKNSQSKFCIANIEINSRIKLLRKHQ